MRWKAWLADGTPVSSEQMAWRDVPAEHVVMLKVWPDDGQKAMYHGLDAIWWDGRGRVYQLDLPPAIKGVARAEAKAGLLKFGLHLPDELYEQIFAEALAAQEP